MAPPPADTSTKHRALSRIFHAHALHLPPHNERVLGQRQLTDALEELGFLAAVSAEEVAHLVHQLMAAMGGAPVRLASFLDVMSAVTTAQECPAPPDVSPAAGIGPGSLASLSPRSMSPSSPPKPPPPAAVSPFPRRVHKSPHRLGDGVPSLHLSTPRGPGTPQRHDTASRVENPTPPFRPPDARMAAPELVPDTPPRPVDSFVDIHHRAPDHPPHRAPDHPQRVPDHPPQRAPDHPPPRVPDQPPQRAPDHPPPRVPDQPPQRVPDYPPPRVPDQPRVPTPTPPFRPPDPRVAELENELAHLEEELAKEAKARPEACSMIASLVETEYPDTHNDTEIDAKQKEVDFGRRLLNIIKMHTASEGRHEWRVARKKDVFDSMSRASTPSLSPQPRRHPPSHHNPPLPIAAFPLPGTPPRESPATGLPFVDPLKHHTQLVRQALHALGGGWAPGSVAAVHFASPCAGERVAVLSDSALHLLDSSGGVVHSVALDNIECIFESPTALGVLPRTRSRPPHMNGIVIALDLPAPQEVHQVAYLIMKAAEARLGNNVACLALGSEHEVVERVQPLEAGQAGTVLPLTVYVPTTGEWDGHLSPADKEWLADLEKHDKTGFIVESQWDGKRYRISAAQRSFHAVRVGSVKRTLSKWTSHPAAALVLHGPVRGHGTPSLLSDETATAGKIGLRPGDLLHLTRDEGMLIEEMGQKGVEELPSVALGGQQMGADEEQDGGVKWYESAHSGPYLSSHDVHREQHEAHWELRQAAGQDAVNLQPAPSPSHTESPQPPQPPQPLPRSNGSEMAAQQAQQRELLALQQHQRALLHLARSEGEGREGVAEEERAGRAQAHRLFNDGMGWLQRVEAERALRKQQEEELHALREEQARERETRARREQEMREQEARIRYEHEERLRREKEEWMREQEERMKREQDMRKQREEDVRKQEEDRTGVKPGSETQKDAATDLPSFEALSPTQAHYGRNRYGRPTSPNPSARSDSTHTPRTTRLRGSPKQPHGVKVKAAKQPLQPLPAPSTRSSSAATLPVDVQRPATPVSSSTGTPHEAPPQTTPHNDDPVFSQPPPSPTSPPRPPLQRTAPQPQTQPPPRLPPPPPSLPPPPPPPHSHMQTQTPPPPAEPAFHTPPAAPAPSYPLVDGPPSSTPSTVVLDPPPSSQQPVRGTPSSQAHQGEPVHSQPQPPGMQYVALPSHSLPQSPSLPPHPSFVPPTSYPHSVPPPQQLAPYAPSNLPPPPHPSHPMSTGRPIPHHTFAHPSQPAACQSYSPSPQSAPVSMTPGNHPQHSPTSSASAHHPPASPVPHSTAIPHPSSIAPPRTQPPPSNASSPPPPPMPSPSPASSPFPFQHPRDIPFDTARQPVQLADAEQMRKLHEVLVRREQLVAEREALLAGRDLSSPKPLKSPPRPRMPSASVLSRRSPDRPKHPSFNTTLPSRWEAAELRKGLSPMRSSSPATYDSDCIDGLAPAVPRGPPALSPMAGQGRRRWQPNRPLHQMPPASPQLSLSHRPQDRSPSGIDMALNAFARSLATRTTSPPRRYHREESEDGYEDTVHAPSPPGAVVVEF